MWELVIGQNEWGHCEGMKPDYLNICTKVRALLVLCLVHWAPGSPVEGRVLPGIHVAHGHVELKLQENGI